MYVTAAPELAHLAADTHRIATKLQLRGNITLAVAPGSYSYVDSDTPTIVYLSPTELQRHGLRVLAHELRHVQQYLTRRLVVASESHGTWAWWEGTMYRLEDTCQFPWETDAETFELQYG
jgi:hypothetical protein